MKPPSLAILKVRLSASIAKRVGRVENLEVLALEFGCKVGRLPTSYLGLPLGAHHKFMAVWGWGGREISKKACHGGLGVRRFSTLNKALLCKWNWRFANERETLWRHVINRKFGEEEGGWYTREVREGFGVGFRKKIRKEGSLLQNKVVVTMGDGRKGKFWKDKWCGNFALCNPFPSLFAFATFKEAWLVELWDSSGEEGVWEPYVL
ncbi:hypothetical protein CK203_023399 [Vitis vinifera]|uniref:Uncharacterized protein n=1 Tax=Vitis vinifera TaxID=29760 RepID=A0A438J6C9_VITVI|nr:hypothetical protein CK203_023399 [Vitis vinifera]